MKKNICSYYANEKMTEITRRFTQIVFFVLLSANFEIAGAATPTINITKKPPIGESGYVAGKVEWDGLTSDNVNQYAVIAMLHAVWDGGGGYYVKPYANNYLNPIDINGNFNIRITTGGIDNKAEEVIFYFVERSKISDADVANPTTMATKYLATKTVFRNSSPKFPLISLMVLLIVIAGVILFIIKKRKRKRIEIEMHKEKNGRPCIKVTFNGALQLYCIIDTGAEKGVISPAVADALLTYEELGIEDFGEEETVRTALGDEFKCRKVTFKTVRIGTKEFKNVEAFYTPDRRAIPLLGQDVLNQFGKTIIDNKNNKIIFQINNQ